MSARRVSPTVAISQAEAKRAVAPVGILNDLLLHHLMDLRKVVGALQHDLQGWQNKQQNCSIGVSRPEGACSKAHGQLGKTACRICLPLNRQLCMMQWMSALLHGMHTLWQLVQLLVWPSADID